MPPTPPPPAAEAVTGSETPVNGSKAFTRAPSPLRPPTPRVRNTTNTTTEHVVTLRFDAWISPRPAARRAVRRVGPVRITHVADNKCPARKPRGPEDCNNDNLRRTSTARTRTFSGQKIKRKKNTRRPGSVGHVTARPLQRITDDGSAIEFAVGSLFRTVVDQFSIGPRARTFPRHGPHTPCIWSLSIRLSISGIRTLYD